MKTNELSGAALDWAAAKCEGILDANDPMQFVSNRSVGMFYYSSKWAQGGAIIEREKINLVYRNDRWHWQASIGYTNYMAGNTPLIAAMRCYVASKLGDEVQLPEELL